MDFNSIPARWVTSGSHSQPMGRIVTEWNIRTVSDKRPQTAKIALAAYIANAILAVCGRLSETVRIFHSVTMRPMGCECDPDVTHRAGIELKSINCNRNAANWNNSVLIEY